jgi:hypothetical protein
MRPQLLVPNRREAITEFARAITQALNWVIVPSSFTVVEENGDLEKACAEPITRNILIL